MDKIAIFPSNKNVSLDFFYRFIRNQKLKSLLLEEQSHRPNYGQVHPFYFNFSCDVSRTWLEYCGKLNRLDIFHETPLNIRPHSSHTACQDRNQKQCPTSNSDIHLLPLLTLWLFTSVTLLPPLFPTDKQEVSSGYKKSFKTFKQLSVCLLELINFAQ